MQLVKTTNPFTGEVTEQLLNTEEVVPGVDSEGRYLGLVTKGTEVLQVPPPPALENYTWNFTSSTWDYLEPINISKSRALIDIDSTAGAARLRYITDVPGQPAVYAAKLEQAQAYLKDNSVIGSYLTSEAEAMGITIIQAAQQIVDKANLWTNTTGPRIETIRRKHKVAIDTAITPEEVFEVRNLAIAELAQI